MDGERLKYFEDGSLERLRVVDSLFTIKLENGDVLELVLNQGLHSIPSIVVGFEALGKGEATKKRSSAER